jgi:prevent-host-death family protein
MDITRDIVPLSEFKQNASKFVKQLQATRSPLILTVNGKPAAVLQDPASFQELSSERTRQQELAVLKQRIKYVDEGGELVPAKDAFDHLSKKYNIDLDLA